MAITFVILVGVMGVITFWKPLETPVVFETRSTLNLEASRGAKWSAVFIVAATIALYAYFW